MSKALKVFVASGSELKEERQEAIMVLTKLGKAHRHLNIEPVEWEIDLPSGSVPEKTIQESINRKLAPCPVVLVIVYSRIGKHTLAEYNLAREMKKKVFFYFKPGFTPKTQAEHKDYVKLEKFIKRVKKESILVMEYRSLKDFHTAFYEDLNLYISQSDEFGIGAGDITVDAKRLTQLPPRLGAFIGREGELKSLKAQLDKPAPVLLVQGLGGIGKTELCKAFLWSHYDDYKQVGWLDYSGSLKATFVSRLEVPGLDIPVSGTIDERFAPIHRYLQGLDKETLLVVDNIDWPEDPDLSLLAAYRFTVLANSRCRVEGFSLFGLEFLPKEGCRKLFYLYYRAQDKKKERAALDRLIDRAGGHTLTVELLARTAHAAGLTVIALEQKLAKIGFNLDGIIKENIATNWGNDKQKHKFFEHLGRVFDLSKLSKKEKSVLANISLLPALPVEMTELKAWLGLDSADILNTLVDKGWLKRAGNGLEMHAVIGEVVRHQERPTAKRCKLLIDALIDKLYTEPGDNPLHKAAYVVYARAVVERLNDDDADLATLANNLSLRFQDLGQLDKALESQEKAVKIWEAVLDPNHPHLASAYNNLSLIYQDLGQLDQALEVQLKTLKIKEKVLGSDHPSLATSYSNLSTIYEAMGEFDQALTEQEKALKIRIALLDPNHPDIATSYHILALIYKDRGQLDRALEYEEKTIKILEAVLDANHPTLASAYNNLSTIYQALGQLDRALEFQLKALAIREKVLAADHPDRAQSYNNLSLIYQDLGQLDKALEFQLKALTIREKVLAPDHPSLATSYNNLCTIYYSLGKLDQALEVQLKTSEIFEKVLGPDHPSLATSYNNLSQIYQDLGQLDKALEFQLKDVAISEKVLGKDHPDLACSYHNLSTIYREMKQYDQALDYARRAVAIMQKLFPAGHPDLDLYKKNLAGVEAGAGQM